MTRRATGGMDPTMKKSFIVALVIAPFLLTGCNTFKGVGEDITGAASWSQEKMSGGGNSSSKKSDADYVQNPPQFPKSN
jgi:predicted small secreted protein